LSTLSSDLQESTALKTARFDLETSSEGLSDLNW